MTIQFLDLCAQYQGIKGDIDNAISTVMADSAFVGGGRCSSFEEAFAAYQECAHCIGVGNGTDALEIALEALGLPKGSEVIVPANSFIATSEAVTRAGLTVVFCDCDPETYTLSAADAHQRITPRTSAIIPVHLYGQPCDMDAVMELANAHRLAVVEDCAQAHGARYRGKPVGSFGVAGTFSFYPGKNLGACGDGGAIVTGSPDFAKRCRMMANHGRIAKYDHEFEGRNSRLDGLQAAILSVKLQYLPQWNRARRERADRYDTLLAGTGIITPAVHAEAQHVYHLYVVQVEDREQVRSTLASQQIQTGVHYPAILPLLAAYRRLGHVPQDFPVASRLASRVLSLPLYPELPIVELEHVVASLLKCKKRRTHVADLPDGLFSPLHTSAQWSPAT